MGVLKAMVSEADKGRELLVRELNQNKDVEHEKIRDVERTKAAEIKVLERLIESMKKDKQDLQERLEEAIMKTEIISSKHQEEHHNTVKYFEGIIAKQRSQISRFSQP